MDETAQSVTAVVIVRLHILCLLVCVAAGLRSCSHSTNMDLRAVSNPLPEQRFSEPLGKTQESNVERRDKILFARQDLNSIVQARFEKFNYPALAVGVIVDGALIWSNGRGTRQVGQELAVNENTGFRIGSLTKLFSGLAILKLRDEGRLQLDDPVSRYLPEIEEVIYPTTDSPRITVRHLLTHTSGLPRLGKLDYTDPKIAVTERFVFDGLKGLVLVSAPGTKTEYSNLAMGLAGLVVQKVSGIPITEYITKQILVPLGMTSSFWSEEDSPNENLATGYKLVDGKPIKGVPWRLGVMAGMGGLYSTLADMSRFAAFQLAAWPPSNSEDIGPVKRSSLRESHLIAGFAHPGEQSFGVNWAPIQHPKLGFVVTHAGGTFLYGSSIWLAIKRGIGVIVLTNTGGENGESAQNIAALAAEVLDIVLKHDPVPAVALSKPLSIRIKDVIRLLNEPTTEFVNTVFSDSFLKAIPTDKVVKVASETGSQVGTCGTNEPLRSLGANAALIRLKCEKGSVEVTLYVDNEKPYKIKGFAVKLE